MHATSLRSPPRPVAAVVFDCDGLLLDTEPGWTVAERAVFERYGKAFGAAEKRALLGAAAADSGRIMERLLDQPGRALELVLELREHVTAELAQAQPLPGAVELVAAVRAAGIPLACASNTHRPLLMSALVSAGLDDAFDVILSADDVPNGKPAPDIYREACRQLDARPTASIGLEDSAAGSTAARAAGMYVIGVPSAESVTLAADLVVASLTDPVVREAIGVD